MKSVQFSLPHIRLAGITNEQTDKPPLLALHGWLDNAGSFERMIPYWQDFNVIAVDLPGHGLSDKRGPDAYYHFVDWIYDVYQLIEHLGWSEFNLVGHSMGAMIGTAFSAAFPDRVRKLFMIDSIGLVTTPLEETTTQLRRAILSRAQIAKRKQKGAYGSFEDAVNARVQAGGVSLEEAQILAKRGVVEIENGYIWRSDQRLRAVSPIRFTTEQAQDLIAQIQCPVMMVAGEEGADMVKEFHRCFAASFRHLECVDMPGGHHCHMTYPQQAASLAAEFLKT